MKGISEEEIIRRIRFENPWWDEACSIDKYFKDMMPRAYLKSLYDLIENRSVRRAVVLMGPRRVGKTVLLHHVIQKLIEGGVDPRKICYVSVEAPIYSGCSLEKIVGFYAEIFKSKGLNDCYIFFDEIQYLKGWEVHLKRLVDDFKDVKFIASGSAAAALKLKSTESGAGRFTDFYLPPLTFYEFLKLQGKKKVFYNGIVADGIDKLNDDFVDYLNFGGYPEAIFSKQIQADPERYIRSDIIDKVLMKDLPGLYGIHDIQELNRLFTMLAYNTGGEVSLDGLSSDSGVAKNTIKKYLEYLEAAFLIKIIHRVDHSAKKFKRANYFKVYLTNPSMRCALFGPVSKEHESMGSMAETAVFSQFLHTAVDRIYYARWKKGEVDLVSLIGSDVEWCLEVKWSNRYIDRPEKLTGLVSFAQSHGLKNVSSTTVDRRGERVIGGVSISFLPTSVHCYEIGLMATGVMISGDERVRELSLGKEIK